MTKIKLLSYQKKYKKAVQWYFGYGPKLIGRNIHLSPKFKKQLDKLSPTLVNSLRFVGTGRTFILEICYIEFMLENVNIWIYPIDIPEPTEQVLFIRNKFLIEQIIKMWKFSFAEKYKKLDIEYSQINKGLRLIKK